MNRYLEPYQVALLQMDCDFLQVSANLEKAEGLIREAAKHGAKLICLPEAFNVGYLSTHISKMVLYAEKEDGPSLSRMRRLARELGVYLLAPILFTSPEGVENTAFFLDNRGEILGQYSKTHLVGAEQACLQRGKSYPVFDTELGKIGISICYDVCFPETVRLLTLSGAEIVLVPAAWRASFYFKEWWDINLTCRALDNLVYVAAVNRCGCSGMEIFAGKSQLCSPIGEVLCTCGIEEERILYGMIDLKRVTSERNFNTVLKDRHPEDYRMLSKPKNEENNLERK